MTSRNSHLRLTITTIALLMVLVSCDQIAAGIVQWRNRVPAGASNTNNFASYVSTVEMRDDVGATFAYDPGLDFDLDTSIVPSDLIYVTYLDHNLAKTEYEFTPALKPGDSFTAYLSVEDRTNNGFYFSQNTIEFLAMDLSDNQHGVTDFAYELKVDSIPGFPSKVYDVIHSGLVSDMINSPSSELPSWTQFIAPGQDHRRTSDTFPSGWYYGELTFTALGTSPNADANGDGHVNGADFLVWQRGYGAELNVADITLMLSSGDFNFDGQVDGTDLAVWQDQYGTISLNAAAVPEPSSCGLFAIILGVFAGAMRFKVQRY